MRKTQAIKIDRDSDARDFAKALASDLDALCANDKLKLPYWLQVDRSDSDASRSKRTA